MVRGPVLVGVAVQSRREPALGTACVMCLRMLFQVQGDHRGGEPGMDRRAEDDERNSFPAPPQAFSSVWRACEARSNVGLPVRFAARIRGQAQYARKDSPGTLRKCRSLRDTTVRPCWSASAAIHRS